MCSDALVEALSYVGHVGEAAADPGGFGPVADDGYGVSYMVAGDKTVFFHISSKKDKENTSSKRFAEALSKALEDISALHDLISAREAQIDESNKSK